MTDDMWLIARHPSNAPAWHTAWRARPTIQCSTIPAAILLLLAGAAACGSERAAGPVAVSEMEITVFASGLDTDSLFGATIDGYYLPLDLGSTNDGTGDSVIVRARVVPGTYAVELTSVAVHCSVSGANPRPVTTHPGQLTPVRFVVSCGASSGVVAVTSVTTGPDPDANGYVVLLQRASGLKRLASNGDTVYFAGIGAGSRRVFLSDLAPNCSENPDNPHSVTVSVGGATRDTARVSLGVTCQARGRIAVAVSTTGVDLDADGYHVAAFPGPPDQSAIVSANGSALIPVGFGGTYTAVLGGMAPNCNATSPTSVSVTVASGDTAAVAFTVSCDAAAPVAFSRGGAIYGIRSNGEGLALLTPSGQSPAWSPDGTRIAFVSLGTGGLGIHVMNADGSGVTLLRPVKLSDQRPAWSPDGSRIAFVDDGDGNGLGEIHVMDADGTGAALHIQGARSDHSPAWSPDGTRIAFSSDRDGAASIYVANADGSGVTRLTQGTDDDRPAWSPDGTRIVFQRTVGDGSGPALETRLLLIMDADGSGLAPLLTGNLYADPAWSPDGAWIAFSVVFCDFYYAYCFGDPSIGVVRPDGSDERVLVPAPAMRPAWRP